MTHKITTQYLFTFDTSLSLPGTSVLLTPPQYLLTPPSLQYLLTVRPFVDDAEYERIMSLAEDFKGGMGRRLQRYLWVKSWWSSNYVSVELSL